jgi:uncharacterized membrane protein HdeD (DUF308 family)
LLGVLILANWPVSGEWVPGVFVGVDLISYGAWLASLGAAVRSLPAPG